MRNMNKSADREIFMDMFALQPIQPDPAMLPIMRLELAPEGWRTCVQRVAAGFAQVIGEHRHCLDCGNVVYGAQGHDATCVTMMARRILANEPLLHAQKTKSSSLAQATPANVVHEGKPLSIEVPVFLRESIAPVGEGRRR
jgi:hypothetical protein